MDAARSGRTDEDAGRPASGVDHPPAGELSIGVSACLLGEKVRFDGGRKRDSFLTGTLARFVTFVPVCPELEIGLGAPRESMRLVESEDGGSRLVAPRSGLDHTRAIERHAKSKLEELAALDLSGFVLEKDSPSCGLERVRVYSRAGRPSRTGRGLLAAALRERFPLLPVEEEGRLSDLELRESFLERVFAYRRVRTLFARGASLGQLVRFHTAEKLLLLAHDPEGYRELGRLVANAGSLPRAELRERYAEKYMEILARRATPGRHANVLEHMLGRLKHKLAPGDEAELLGLLRDLRAGLVPPIVPITLLRHHVRVHGVAYPQGLRYLEPHPKELLLRNHV